MSQSRRTGVLNLSLLFGTAVIALDAHPHADAGVEVTDTKVFANAPIEYDKITTGSIPSSKTAKRYTVRRSVLQEMPGAVCIIDGDGEQKRLLIALWADPDSRFAPAWVDTGPIMTCACLSFPGDLSAGWREQVGST